MLVREDKAWDYAVGMIKVDGLEPSPEMKELIEREKRGEITMEQVREVLCTIEALRESLETGEVVRVDYRGFGESGGFGYGIPGYLSAGIL